MKGLLIAPGPFRAGRVLAALPAVRDVQMFGDRLNVIVDRPDDALPALRSALAGAGLELESWRTVPPSLENVFMAVAARH